MLSFQTVSLVPPTLLRIPNVFPPDEFAPERLRWRRRVIDYSRWSADYFGLAKTRLHGYKFNEGSVRVDSLVTRKGKRGKGTVGLFLVY